MISSTNNFMLVTLAISGFLLTATSHSAALNSNNQDLVPTGKGWGELPDPGRQNQELANFPGQRAPASKGAARPKPGNGISYHGGPVMLGTTNVYYIWYGDWSGNTATEILADFASNIGGSPYYNINTTYNNGGDSKLSNSVSQPVITSVTYPYGKSLSDAQIKQVVIDARPTDPNGVYFVLTSADVTASSGFCTQYCGWHTHATIGGRDIKYSFVGNPDRCPSACAAQTTGPNDNAGADGMASIIAHELEEATTDPDLNAWYDTRGYENADKCAWTFGSTIYTTSNGANANMKLGTRDYLIQRNWVNASGGYCALSY
jgi:hypothetical protein